jgi:hypothetical protein
LPRCPDPPWPPAATDADASSLRAAGPALPLKSPPNPVWWRWEKDAVGMGGEIVRKSGDLVWWCGVVSVWWLKGD